MYNNLDFKTLSVKEIEFKVCVFVLTDRCLKRQPFSAKFRDYVSMYKPCSKYHFPFLMPKMYRNS